MIEAAGTGRIASWGIIQDIGMGFFGTEVQSATLSMSMRPGIPEGADPATQPAIAAGDAMLACYSGAEQDPTRDGTDPTIIDPTAPGSIGYRAGDFTMSRCGLIPERHDNSRDSDGALMITDTTNTITLPAGANIDTERAAASAATPRAHALARYDAMDETTVVVWLAEGQDTEDTHARDSRMLDVTVTCEDGTIMDMMEDQYGDMVPLRIPAPNKLTMIDPTMGALGDATSMCAGDRGVLRFTMPDKSSAGIVFSHVAQMDNHFRMNFPGYGMANPVTCFEMTMAAGDTDGNGSINGDETLMDVNGDGPETLVEADEFAAARTNACMAR